MLSRTEEEEFTFCMASSKPVCIISLTGDLTSKNKKKFENFLTDIKEREESHFIIQCRDIKKVDQIVVLFLGRIYATLKNVRKDQFAFCSIEESLKKRLVDNEIFPKDKIILNLKTALTDLIKM